MQPEFMKDREEAMDRVERTVQYRFRNRQLLEEALTHKSFFPNGCGPSNDRLAYIGDAVIYLLYSKKFYCQDRGDSGRLTELRKSKITRYKQARVAVQHNLFPLLRRRYCSDLHPKISQFTTAVTKEPTEEYPRKMVPEMLAEMIEAIIGAVYVDSTFDLEVVNKVTMLLFEEETFQCRKNHWLKHIFRGILAAFIIGCTLAAMDTSSDHAIIYDLFFLVSFIVGFAGFAWFSLKILWVLQTRNLMCTTHAKFLELRFLEYHFLRKLDSTTLTIDSDEEWGNRWDHRRFFCCFELKSSKRHNTQEKPRKREPRDNIHS